MKNIYLDNLKKDVFYILKFLYQHNNYNKEEEELKFENDCYTKNEFNYLI